MTTRDYVMFGAGIYVMAGLILGVLMWLEWEGDGESRWRQAASAAAFATLGPMLVVMWVPIAAVDGIRMWWAFRQLRRERRAR